MSRCWLLICPRLTIEPSRKSATGSVSMRAYRRGPTFRPSAICLANSPEPSYSSSATRSRVDEVGGVHAPLAGELSEPCRSRPVGRLVVLPGPCIARYDVDAVHRGAVRNDLGAVVDGIGIVPHPLHVELHHIAGFLRRVDRGAGPLGDIGGFVLGAAMSV